MRRALKILGFLVLALVLGAVLFIASLRVEHTFETALPAPTGPFAVGRMIEPWRDAQRELLVWIWYPAASAGMSEEYMPARLRAEIERARPALINKFLTRDLSKVHAHSVRNAEMAASQRPYPIVILRAGASVEVVHYSTLAEDLASHGYVVVGFDAPGRTNVVAFPDGRVMRRKPENNPEQCLPLDGDAQSSCASKFLRMWVADTQFVLDRLQTHHKFSAAIDPSRVGIVGHSFGGATAAQFCHDDARCKAGIDIDGAPQGDVIRTGLHRPFLFLLSDHGDMSDPVSRRIMGNIRSIHERLPVNDRPLIIIPGASHFFFSDDAGLLKSRIFIGVLRIIGKVGMDGRRQLAVTNQYVHGFFDTYLKGQPR
jgi:dienelactone hydrolase